MASPPSHGEDAAVHAGPTKEAPLRPERLRLARVVVISLILLAGALAIGGGRLVETIRRWREPPPAPIIIVAPTDSETI
jgi:hypothetical protein